MNEEEREIYELLVDYFKVTEQMKLLAMIDSSPNGLVINEEEAYKVNHNMLEIVFNKQSELGRKLSFLIEL